MFLGEFQPTFTGKGRVALPKKMREVLSGGEVVLSKGFEPCIFGYQRSTWETEAQKQMETGVSDANSRNLRRYLFSSASISELDAQGRFVIPEPLLSYAGIHEEVTVIGAGDHFEIWDTNKWHDYLRNLEHNSQG